MPILASLVMVVVTVKETASPSAFLSHFSASPLANLPASLETEASPDDAPLAAFLASRAAILAPSASPLAA